MAPTDGSMRYIVTGRVIPRGPSVTTPLDAESVQG